MMIKMYKLGGFQNPVVMVHDGNYAVMLCDGKSQKCQFSSLHTPQLVTSGKKVGWVGTKNHISDSKEIVT